METRTRGPEAELDPLVPRLSVPTLTTPPPPVKFFLVSFKRLPLSQRWLLAHSGSDRQGNSEKEERGEKVVFKACKPLGSQSQTARGQTQSEFTGKFMDVPAMWQPRLGLHTCSNVSPPGGVNMGHSSPAALAMARISLSGLPSTTPYFCNSPGRARCCLHITVKACGNFKTLREEAQLPSPIYYPISSDLLVGLTLAEAHALEHSRILKLGYSAQAAVGKNISRPAQADGGA